MAASSSRRPIAPKHPAVSSTKARHSPEAFQSLYERNEAVEALQRYELLSWYSFVRCESLTQTRLHCQNIVAGFSPEDEAALVQCREDFTPHPPRPDEASRKGKERERVSSGQGAVAGPSGTRATDATGGNEASASTAKARESTGAGAVGTGSGNAGANLSKKKRRSGEE
ncbi:hypothetical protein LTR12_014221 [Friedmanniomyces endolithicus]|nr:hypothetical protein LTR12_014221 [Friedmanniomyces endolithicus]